MAEKTSSEKMYEQNQKMLERLSLVEKQLSTISEEIIAFPKPPAEKHEEKKGHATLEDQIACPDCYPKIEALVMPKLKPKILKEIVDKAKGKYHCRGCGLKVEKETPSCPLCGETHTE